MMSVGMHCRLLGRPGRIVDHPTRTNEFINVSGGWADASDYLQYVTTSANATFVMLMAYRDNPKAFGDKFDARGLPGKNGVPDVLDEAKHGLDWLLRMYPGGEDMFNQLADDRDHMYFDFPWKDSSDYGWGKGKERPVYPCTGKPQGLYKYKNRSTGYASTAGKYASAFATAAGIFRKSDPEFAKQLQERALAAYKLGVEHPGVCQTASAVSPYFYEEDNWHDDMELGAAALFEGQQDRGPAEPALHMGAQVTGPDRRRELRVILVERALDLVEQALLVLRERHGAPSRRTIWLDDVVLQGPAIPVPWCKSTSAIASRHHETGYWCR